MKKYIIFLILLTSIVNYLYSFDKSKVTVETGDFYFLVGTEGNERAIMYLHILGSNAYGSYYTEIQSITSKDGFDGFNGSFDGRNLKLSYHDDNDRERTITGTLSSDIVFRGKHNSKNVNLSLANATINNMKIFNYSYGDDIFWNDTTIIHPKDYNERKLINDYNSVVESDEEYSEYGINHNSSESIVYIDDKIIIFYVSYYGNYGGASSAGGQAYTAYPTTDMGSDSNEIRISDFIANPKDRRLLSLIRNKYNECFNSNFSSDDFENFEDVINGEIDVEYLDFSISPKGTITIYDSYMHSTGSIVDGYLWATFTFEELKPYIKRGSPLDYLFN